MVTIKSNTESVLVASKEVDLGVNIVKTRCFIKMLDKIII
jgi:hypothetical protein